MKGTIKFMEWDKSRNNVVYEKGNIKYPEETVITVDFDDTKVVGKATNFIEKEDGIYCDVEIDEQITNTIAPKFLTGTIIEKDGKYYPSDVKLISVSFINEHSCENCNNNVTISEK